jgi:hypothetical protein
VLSKLTLEYSEGTEVVVHEDHGELAPVRSVIAFDGEI